MPRSSVESRTLATIRLQFVNTDVSDVLQAISVKTHANIVYPALLKRPISLNITAGSVGEAIGYAASAAGLTWKQLGQTFVVAPASDLKQMIEAFGQSEVVERNDVPSADAITLLTGGAALSDGAAGRAATAVDRQLGRHRPGQSAAGAAGEAHARHADRHRDHRFTAPDHQRRGHDGAYSLSGG